MNHEEPRRIPGAAPSSFLKYQAPSTAAAEPLAVAHVDTTALARFGAGRRGFELRVPYLAGVHLVDAATVVVREGRTTLVTTVGLREAEVRQLIEALQALLPVAQ